MTVKSLLNIFCAGICGIALTVANASGLASGYPRNLGYGFGRSWGCEIPVVYSVPLWAFLVTIAVLIFGLVFVGRVWFRGHFGFPEIGPEMSWRKCDAAVEAAPNNFLPLFAICVAFAGVTVWIESVVTAVICVVFLASAVVSWFWETSIRLQAGWHSGVFRRLGTSDSAVDEWLASRISESREET